MSKQEQLSGKEKPSTGRLILGGCVLVAGQFFSVFVPAIAGSGLSLQMTAFLSGAMYFVLPELCFMAAVAIWGNPGYQAIKAAVFRFLGRQAPRAVVGGHHYRLGLVMFTVPLGLAWLSPYLVSADDTALVTTPYAIASDAIFLASFFVLGGEFWDKFRALFVPTAVAHFPSKPAAAAD